MGLDDARITCILDNSSQKVGRRLYGSNLSIANPEKLKESASPLVILKVGQYFEEVKNQFWELTRTSRLWSKTLKVFILDVDGVMTSGQFIYGSSGKCFKIFGPDDSDGLSILKSKLEYDSSRQTKGV